MRLQAKTTVLFLEHDRSSGYGKCDICSRLAADGTRQGLTVDDLVRGARGAAQNIEQEIPKIGPAVGRLSSPSVRIVQERHSLSHNI
ncbi:MAG: hypothetical protein HC938_16075 [Nitrospira sp.]|nr:hypothetical protein [Nitrospira sp.]